MLVESSFQGRLVRHKGATHHTDFVEREAVGFHQR